MPNVDCLKKFKVFAKDWDLLNDNENIYCPFCRHKNSIDKWWTTEQVEKAKEQAAEDVKYKIHESIKRDAETFNKKQQKGFITFQMQVGRMKKPIQLPLVALETMQQEITCKYCQKNMQL